MRSPKWLTAVVLMGAAAVAAAQDTLLPPQVAISPPRVEIEMERGSAQSSVRLFNMGDKPIDVEVTVADWYLDENNQLQVEPPDDESLAHTLLMNPSQFQVAGGESQAVRFAVRPRLRPRDGEHRMMLFLNEKPSAADTSNRFIFEFQVPVYVLTGDVQRIGELYGVQASFADGVLDVGFDVASDGNASVRLQGSYVVRRVDDGMPRLQKAVYVAEMANGVVLEGSLPHLPVFAGTRRVLHTRTELPLSPGRYIVEAQGELSGEPVTATREFVVSGP